MRASEGVTHDTHRIRVSAASLVVEFSRKGDKRHSLQAMILATSIWQQTCPELLYEQCSFKPSFQRRRFSLKAPKIGLIIHLAPHYIGVADRTCHCRYAHSYTLSLVRYMYCLPGNGRDLTKHNSLTHSLSEPRP